MTQKESILSYLQEGNTLTPLQSLELFGCMALSQRIGELKKEGYPIISEMIETSTGKHIAEYSYRTPFG